MRERYFFESAGDRRFDLTEIQFAASSPLQEDSPP